MTDNNEPDAKESPFINITPLPLPFRIIWKGPESSEVWLDEDGASIRWGGAGAMEAPDVHRLIELYQRVEHMAVTGAVPVPAPPTEAEMKSDRYYNQRRIVAKAMSRAAKEMGEF